MKKLLVCSRLVAAASFGPSALAGKKSTKDTWSCKR